MTIESCIAVIAILVAQVGHVCVHVWARYDHTDWAHRPRIKGFKVSNPFHVASFLSNWPTALCIIVLASMPLWLIAVTAICSKVVWMITKRRLGKKWPSWEKQLYDYYSNQ